MKIMKNGTILVLYCVMQGEDNAKMNDTSILDATLVDTTIEVNLSQQMASIHCGMVEDNNSDCEKCTSETSF
jgi:hypothetical protein